MRSRRGLRPDVPTAEEGKETKKLRRENNELRGAIESWNARRSEKSALIDEHARASVSGRSAGSWGCWRLLPRATGAPLRMSFCWR